MGSWTGTVPTILAGDIVTGDDWKTITDILNALTGTWTDYTTDFSNGWTAVTTNPTVGNSTVAARYRLLNKTLDVAFSIIIGSTFVAGSGNYEWGFPSGLFAASHRRLVGGAYVLDSGTADRYGGQIIGTSAGNRFIIGFTNTTVAHNQPQVWATGDEIRGSFTVETA